MLTAGSLGCGLWAVCCGLGGDHPGRHSGLCGGNDPSVGKP